MQWPLWEKPFVELSTLQNFLHFYCTNLRPNLSAQLWWFEFAQIQSWHLLRRYYNLLVSGSIGHESSPQASYINIPAVPKRPRNYPKTKTPWIALVIDQWSRPASAGSANLCYSDDTLSPAIVLLLWCYSPLSLVFECYSSCAIATTPFCLVPDCFDLFHKVEILHLAQQGIAASLSECPWLTPTPVIINHTWSVIVDDHSSLYVWCSNVGRGHGAADFNVNVSNADFKMWSNFEDPAGRGRLFISCIFGPYLVGWSAVVIFSEESKEVDQQLVRYEVDQLRSCQPIHWGSWKAVQFINWKISQLSRDQLEN